MMDNFCFVIILIKRVMYRSLYSSTDVFFKSFPAQKNTLTQFPAFQSVTLPMLTKACVQKCIITLCMLTGEESVNTQKIILLDRKQPIGVCCNIEYWHYLGECFLNKVKLREKSVTCLIWVPHIPVLRFC